MKYLHKISRPFLMLGAVVLAGGAAWARKGEAGDKPAGGVRIPGLPGVVLPPVSRPAEPKVEGARIAVTVDLLDIRCLKAQEIGHDEPFVLWSFSKMDDSKIAPRGTSFAGVTNAVDIKKGERKDFVLGRVARMFDAVLDGKGALSGGLQAWEDDESQFRTKPPRAEWNRHLSEHVAKERGNLEWDRRTNARDARDDDMLLWANQEWARMPSRAFDTGFPDKDDKIAALLPFHVAAIGPASEEREWTATGDGASYAIRFRITRRAIATQNSTPPASTPASPPAGAPIGQLGGAPVTSLPAGSSIPATLDIPVAPGIPTAPAIPTIPVVTAPATGGARPLGEWSVQVESMRVVRDRYVEVVANYKNVVRDRRGLDAGTVQMILTDADGLGWHNVGNLYKPGNDADMEPEKERGPLWLESGKSARTLVLFELPPGTPPIKTLSIFGAHNVKPLAFDASGLALPEPARAALPATSALGGTRTFADLAEFGLRVDGVRRGPNGTLQAILSIQNRDKLRWIAHPGFSLDVSATGADGLVVRATGSLYRASGDGTLEPERVPPSARIVPGATATLLYVLPMKAAQAQQLVVKYRDQKVSVALPALPAAQ